MFHPKVVHSDHHSSIQFLNSRHDPNVGLINGGYPMPLLNLHPGKEYKINEEDFFKWRREQQRRAQEKRRQLQQQNHNKRNQEYDEYEDNGGSEDEEDESNYDEELYKKHKANKSSSSGYRKESKQKNHSYSDRDYDSSSSDKIYSKGNPSTSKQKGRRPPSRSTVEDEITKKYRVYGVSNVDAESSNVKPQFLSHDPTAIDPGHYSTLPKNLQNPPTNQDDIYSGLLAKKYNKEIAEKSKLLADINYNRKQQTKNLIQRKGQE